MKRHFENLTAKASRTIRHWWLMLIAGILCIAAGICVFIFPAESYVVISILFGIVMLATGIGQLMISSTSGNYLMMRGYFIVGGILDVILGIFLCAFPGVTFVVLPFLMGLWLMYHSFMLIAFGGDMDTFKIPGSGWTTVLGILILLLSVFVLVNPMSIGIMTILTIASVGLIIIGIGFCMLSTKLKDIKKELERQNPAD